MKSAIIAFAAIFALTGATFAADKVACPSKSSVKQAQQEQPIDPGTTGSIPSKESDSSKKPRLGIELNPFSFGTFH